MAYAVSDAFKRALGTSHVSAIKVDIYTAGILVKTLTTVTSGYITVKRDDSSRRSAYIVIADDTGALTPDGTVSSTLNIYDCEMYIYRGIQSPSGYQELVPLGVFPINNIEMAESGQALYLKIAGSDRSRKVERSTFPTAYVIADGTNAITAITAMLISQYPRILFGQVDQTSYSLPQLVYTAGSNPWEIVTKLANSIGYEVFFDVNGYCVIRKNLVIQQLPTTWEFVEGDNCVMLSQQKYYTDEPRYNWFVVTAENAGSAIIRAEAKDLNPSSPTYIYGPYGKNVKLIGSSEIKTQGQAQEYADRELKQALGLDEMIYLTTIVNPALDIDDIVYCKRAKAKTDGFYVVDQQTIPLDTSAVANVGIRKLRGAT